MSVADAKETGGRLSHISGVDSLVVVFCMFDSFIHKETHFLN